MEKDNLLELGEKIKEVRKKKKISQLDLSLEADIDRKTISRIENGLNEPSMLTLYKISQSLNYDFIREYVDTSLHDYVIFNKTFNRFIEKLEHKINFEEEAKIISSLEKDTRIAYIKTSCKQVLLFIKSIDHLTKVGEREFLIKALNCFGKKSSNLDENSYTDFELRILMDIAMTYTNIDNEKCINLLKFVYDRTSIENPLYPIICINLANAYIVIEKYDNCLEIINSGISYYLDKNEIPNPVLYFTRSVYKRLNGINYLDDYEKAIMIAKLAENSELIKIFKDTKKAYDEIKGSE